MFAKVIQMNLTSESIGEAIRELRRFQKQLKKAMEDLATALTNEGVQVAKMQVAEMPAIDTGYLQSSIYGYYDPDSHIGYVFAPAPYAFYVEYGTGIIGQQNPHPQAQEHGIQYDVNDHGYGGWWYKTDEAHGIFTVPTRGKNPENAQTHLAWTQGMPARPFMYNTAKTLETAAQTITNRYFSNM